MNHSSDSIDDKQIQMILSGTRKFDCEIQDLINDDELGLKNHIYVNLKNINNTLIEYSLVRKGKCISSIFNLPLSIKTIYELDKLLLSKLSNIKVDKPITFSIHASSLMYDEFHDLILNLN
ncbi:hypothetical protein L4D76_00400 [Photobacterium sagamiensis]|uniref:hypothetical protein n=1 Tax=Photobacterium sagamiensis TaxID=2910241 RepID=UPI003D0B8643